MWKTGPLPPNTWNWGGVVTKEIADSGGFFLADFCGNHVVAHGANGPMLVQAADVVLYNNSIELPPGGKGRA